MSCLAQHCTAKADASLEDTSSSPKSTLIYGTENLFAENISEKKKTQTFIRFI
jgi:hypothetical protein